MVNIRRNRQVPKGRQVEPLRRIPVAPLGLVVVWLWLSTGLHPWLQPIVPSGLSFVGQAVPDMNLVLSLGASVRHSFVGQAVPDMN